MLISIHDAATLVTSSTGFDQEVYPGTWPVQSNILILEVPSLIFKYSIGIEVDKDITVLDLEE